MAKKEITLGDWENLLSAEHTFAEKVPEGWFTSKQLMAKYNITDCKFWKLLNKLISERAVEVKKFRIYNSNHDKIDIIPHYKSRKLHVQAKKK